MPKQVDSLVATPHGIDANRVREGAGGHASSHDSAVGDRSPEAVTFLSEGTIGIPDKIGPNSGYGRITAVVDTKVIWHDDASGWGDPLNRFWTLGVKLVCQTDEYVDGAWRLCEVGTYRKGSEVILIREPDTLVMGGLAELYQLCFNFVLEHNLRWEAEDDR